MINEVMKPFEDKRFRTAFYGDYLTEKIKVFKQHEVLGLAYLSEIPTTYETISNVTNQITNVLTSDLVFINVKNYGAAGDGKTDDTLPILAATAAAGDLGGGTIYFPPGTYIFDPGNYFYSVTRGVRYAILLRSDNLHYLGTTGSVLKFADNISSDAAPLNMAFFASNTHRQNISFTSLVIDFSGNTNPINGGPAGALKFHALIAFVGESGRGSNITIENCYLKDSAGSNVIVCASGTTSTSYTMGENWKISKCKFYNHGIDSTDFSAIWGWCRGLLVEDCDFWQASMPAYSSVKCACEIHGRDGRFINNRVWNYTQMLWIGPNFSEDVDGARVHGNVGNSLLSYGVKFYRENGAAEVAAGTSPEVEDNITGADIYENEFVFGDADPGPTGANTDYFGGVYCNTKYGISGVRVYRNIVRRTGDESSNTYIGYGIRFVPGNGGEPYDDFEATENDLIGMTYGVDLLTGATAGSGFGKVTVCRNKIKNLRDQTNVTYPKGITGNFDAANPVGWLIVKNNEVENDEDVGGTGNNNIGLALYGYYTRLDMDGNVFSGLEYADIVEAMTDVDYATGRQAHYIDVDFDTDDVLVTGIADTVHGVLYVKETVDDVSAIYRIQNGTLASISADAAYSTTKDNAGTHNVYFEGNVIKAQNKVGNNKAIKLRFEES